MAITDYLGSDGSGLEDMSCGMKLTYYQRMVGFGICYGVGVIVSLISTFSLWTGNITGFAILYTVGNVISLMATGFLVGFLHQFKKMFEKVRIVSAIIFIVSMALTITFAVLDFPLHSLPTLIFCIIQFFALFWYSISYIPFAHSAILRMFGWK